MSSSDSCGRTQLADDPPVKDHGRITHKPPLPETSGQQKWEEQQAMYVGLRYPGDRKKRKHRKHCPKSRDFSEDGERDEDSKNAPATPGPGERVAYILGREEEDDDEDHQCHDIFCEMEELRPVGDDGVIEWKETARWIKFEEDVEEGGDRWSKPHVATLSLHSLFELRRGLLSGTVILDMDATSLNQITDILTENMSASGFLDAESRNKLTETVLMKHRHQHQRGGSGGKGAGLPMIRSLADIGRKMSARTLEHKDSNAVIYGVTNEQKPTLTENKSSQGANLSIPGGSGKDLQSADLSSSIDLTDPHKYNQHFLKKIPIGAEAANIMVGVVDFLPSLIMAFIRLQRAIILGDVTEVPVPTRFIFLLLGPPPAEPQKYHEIGRSIATLMSDEVFHDVAYKARDSDELLSAIDEFLDCVTVLPPGEWDPTIRIEPPKSVPSQEKRKKPSVAGGYGNGAGGGLIITQPADGVDGDKLGHPNGKLSPVIETAEEEQHGDPTLIITGRFCGGLINDIKRKAPWYVSDFKDAIHVQSIATLFFMYFACLTPIITFGGLLGAATGNYIAAMESLVSGAICGISYHMLAGQPLTIIGSTGPVLVFETIVYKFCLQQEWNYLEFRFWIGMWMCVWLLLLVAFDLSALVRFITRFTEESFAMLIAIIFIAESFMKLFEGLHRDPVNLHPDQPLDYNCTCFPPFFDNTRANVTPLLEDQLSEEDGSGIEDGNVIVWESLTREECADKGGLLVGTGCKTPYYVPNVFFLSCLLFIGTFTLSMALKMFRNTRFFPNKMRVMISDFAVFTAICSMVFLDYMIGLRTKKLEVPENLRPTHAERHGWVVNPFTSKNPWYAVVLGLPPSILSTILIFMDQQITAVIINRKEHRLKKGSGYHLDLLIITMQIFTCTCLGTPWFVAATVLSINHVRSLTIESEAAAPGERPKFLGIREQRVTGTIVFILVGLSAFMANVLKLIPMAVLYGVFLFMGISSLKGIQFVQRVLVVFMPAKYQPDYMFLRHVPIGRVHLFTLIQSLCLGGLFVIKEIQSISIVFPLMVLGMCFIRKSLDHVFTQKELKWLDDIMPDTHKHDKDKKKLLLVEHGKEMDECGSDQPDKLGMSREAGCSMTQPAPPSYHSINISEEMSKTSIWRQLSSPNNSQPNLRSRKSNSEADSAHKTEGYKERKPDGGGGEQGNGGAAAAFQTPVKFKIADEEDEDEELVKSAPCPHVDENQTTEKGCQKGSLPPTEV